MASKRPPRRSASSLIEGAGSIAATFQAENVTQVPSDSPSKRSFTGLPKRPVATDERPVLRAEVPVIKSVTQPRVPAITEPEAAAAAPAVILDPVVDVAPVALIVAEADEPTSTEPVEIVPQVVTAPGATPSQVVAPRQSAIRKPVAVAQQTVVKHRSPMSAYSKAMAQLNKVIKETDLTKADGRGVFDDYTTNMSKIRYEKGVSYNDLLPLNFTTGFNSGLERTTFQMTQHQVEESKKFSNYLGREIRRNGGDGQKVVRSSSISMLHRIMQDFFIANAPRDCFDAVDGEQSARAAVGLQPLPELEIYENAVASHDLSTGPMNPRITETTLVTAEGWGVFDDFTTNMTKIRYEKGVKYSDLLPITFPTGFNSGLERGTFHMTIRQIEESKKFSSYLSREIKNSMAPSLRAVRSTAVSMIHRIMQDFFIANAPQDCFDGVGDEQEARARVGLPPLPELEIFEYEINKQVQELSQQ